MKHLFSVIANRSVRNPQSMESTLAISHPCEVDPVQSLFVNDSEGGVHEQQQEGIFLLSLRTGLFAIHKAWRAIVLFHIPVEWILYSPCTG